MKEKKSTLLAVLGLLFSVCMLFPYFILKKGSIITYHDQLDGELLCYILHAKYLFTGVKVYPEMMNGIPATGLTPPAMLFVLLYKIFTPFVALGISQWIIYAVSFLGMYLLIRKLGNGDVVAFLCGNLFMLLPFYPVYGLCIPGQPLLLLCLLVLCTETKPGKKIACYLYIFIYSLCSSLVLVGFAVLIFVTVFGIVLAFKRARAKERIPKAPFISLAILLVGYAATNIDLIIQVIMPQSGYESHKSELVHSFVGFKESFMGALFPGVNYTETWPVMVLVLGLIAGAILICSIVRKEIFASELKHRFMLGICSILIALVCIAGYSVYYTQPVTKLLEKIGGAIGSFNLGRVVWLTPTAWIVSFSYFARMLCIFAETKKHRSLRYIAGYGLVWISVFIWSIVILIHSPIKANVSKIIKGQDYYALDYGKFYATDIYDQIDKAINLPKDSYRVVSLGIYPAAALYNGFYCLDGYSNNYLLSYKHEFRKAMASELDKSDYIKGYYDDWGNRCYLMTAEYNNYFALERKWNGGFHNLSIDTNQLKKMGCKYIFAATWIENSDELGLIRLSDEPFVSDRSWYNIYVYEIM